MTCLLWLTGILTTFLMAGEVAARASPQALAEAIRSRSTPARALKPVTRRQAGIDSREVSTRCLIPTMELSTIYGEDETAAAYSPVVYFAELRLKAHKNQPLVLLEAFESLVSDIDCNDAGMLLKFHDPTDAELAAEIWTSLDPFIIVSSHAHAGCNTPKDRAPHLVLDVISEPHAQAVKLSSRPVDWDYAYKSVSVTLDHFRPDRELRFVRRDDSNDNSTDDGAQANTTVSFKTTPDPRVPLFNISGNAGPGGSVAGELDVTCVGCSTDGQLLVKAAVDVDSDLFRRGNPADIQRRDFDIAELQTAFIEVEVAEELKATINLEMSTSAQIDKKFKQKLVKITELTPFTIGEVLTLGPILEFDVSAHLTSGAASLNFTYGAEITVPKGSIAVLDWANLSNSQAHGWDNSNVTQIPFTINDLSGDLTFGIELAAEPSLSFGVEVGPNGILGSATVGFTAQLPAVHAQATYKQNVTSSCKPLGPNDYNYYPDAVSIDSGMTVSVNFSAQAEIGDDLPDFMQESFDKMLLSKDFPFPERCMAFDRKTLGELQLASATDPQVNVTKVEEEYRKTSKLPSGVNPSVLATYTNTPVPSDLEKAVQKGGADSLKVVGWLAYIGVLMVSGFFVLFV